MTFPPNLQPPRPPAKWAIALVIMTVLWAVGLITFAVVGLIEAIQ